MAQKKLTAREKELRAKYKKKLQEEGILPPDKPRLNRKKFIEEALANGMGGIRAMWMNYISKKHLES